MEFEDFNLAKRHADMEKQKHQQNKRMNMAKNKTRGLTEGDHRSATDEYEPADIEVERAARKVTGVEIDFDTIDDNSSSSSKALNGGDSQDSYDAYSSLV